MNRFKTILKNTFSYVERLFQTHPVTFFTICAGTVLAIILSFCETNALNLGAQGNSRMEQILVQWILTAVMFCLFAFCIESSRLKAKMPLFVSIPVYSVGFVCSFFLASLLYAQQETRYILLHKTFSFYHEMIGAFRADMIFFGLCLILLLLGIAFSYESMKDVSFASYCIHIYSGFFFTGIICSILCTGTAALTGIFTVLLWGDFEKVFLPVLALLMGGYYIMRCATIFTERPGYVNGFIHVLIRYVLLIMCLIAYVIIYAYMIKILVLQEFPSNSVYSILTALFVISMPVSYMSAGMPRRRAATDPDGDSEADNEQPANDVIGKIARILPIVFSPFVLLQIYTAAVRIRQYGLTPKRYFGALFIVFEIAAIVLYILSLRSKKFQMSLILKVLAAFVLVASLLPFVNAIGMSRFVQASCMDRYLLEEDSEHTDAHVMSRAAAAYEYLKEDENRRYLEKHFTAKECDRLDLLIRRDDVQESLDEENYEEEEWEGQRMADWSAQENELDLDISEYSRIRYGYLAAVDDSSVDLKNVGFYLNEDGTIPRFATAYEVMEGEPSYTLDLCDYGNRFLELARDHYDGLSDREFQDAMQEIRTIPVNDTDIFYVAEAELTYDNDSGKISELLLRGYYLTK